MKVIRQLCYEADEELLRKQLANSLPNGVKEVRGLTIDVRTVYSELPELPPFVERLNDDPHFRCSLVTRSNDFQDYL